MDVASTLNVSRALKSPGLSLPLAADAQLPEMEAVFARQPDPNDPDQYAFEGYTVDLSEAVKDALVLQLPMRFLCKEDCRGLCPKCGVNLNTGSCSCREGEDDVNPFSVLRSIVENDEEV